MWESLPLPVTAKNIERASRLRSEIVTRIAFDNFTLDDYRSYFPHSIRVKHLERADFFGVLAQQWLDGVEVSPNSRDEYRKALNRYWMPQFAGRQIGTITYSELRMAVNQIPWANAKTRNNALIPQRGVFDLAFEDEIIDRNPAAKLKNRKHQRPPPTLSLATKSS